MGELVESKLCPKRDRCKYGEECIDTDVFRGEYLCFESNTVNIYEHEQQLYAASKKKGQKS
ncbi:MAG: hypothetical protein E7485_08315 [Ruminococcaceae bacterium]|nr:hypothetical protein [Oscillospiraceae bacterium]